MVRNFPGFPAAAHDCSLSHIGHKFGIARAVRKYLIERVSGASTTHSIRGGCQIRPCYEISHSPSNTCLRGLESPVVASVIQSSERHQFLSCHIFRQTLPHRDAPYKGGIRPR